jgi:hypothetical protein
MKKNVVAIILALFFLVPALRARGTPISIEVPDADKIKIIGGTIFFVDMPYLSINATLSRLGTPVLGAKIRMNGVELRGSSGGSYAGSISPYKSNLGDDYVFTVETLARLPSGGVSPRREMVVLASYRVDNLLTWISPSPGQVIDLSAYPLGEIPVRWRFAGTRVPFQLRITDSVTHAEIISKIVDSEGYTIPTVALRPGKTYFFSVTTVYALGCGPLGRFKLGKLAAPGSEVRFDCGYAFGFSTAAAK